MSDSKAAAPSGRGKTFKPRAGIVRKSKAEREAHAKQEAEKAAARATAAAKVAGKPVQTAKSSTSKKRDPPKDSRDGSQGTVGGVFGVGSGTRQGWKKSIVDDGRSEMLEGQEAAKPSNGPTLQGQDGEGSGTRLLSSGGKIGTTGNTGRNTRATRDEPFIDSDDEPDEQRRDIERIWISSGDEGEGEEGERASEDQAVHLGKGKARALSKGAKIKQGGGLRPVRAPRNLAEDQEAEVDGRGDKKKTKLGPATHQDAAEVNDADEMEIDDDVAAIVPSLKPDVPSSPEISKRGKPGKRIGSRTKDSKTTTETVEERAERLRLNEDIEKLREEFITSPKIKKQDDEENVEEQVLRPDAKLFLFQLPPLVPFLLDQASIPPGGLDLKQHKTSVIDPVIKNDPDEPTTTAVATTGGDANSAASIPRTQVEGMLTATEPLRLPAGRIGKLRVHRSGKVTLDWGGTDMEVRYGTDVDFLQDAILVQAPDISRESESKNLDGLMGTTYALGQVKNKMIIIPDWQKLYD